MDTLEDIKIWIAGHAAKMDAYWNEQHQINRRIEDKTREISNRLSTLEKRVIVLSFLAAGAGGTIGNLLTGII